MAELDLDGRYKPLNKQPGDRSAAEADHGSTCCGSGTSNAIKDLACSHAFFPVSWIVLLGVMQRMIEQQ
jgi:hypothetical protein